MSVTAFFPFQAAPGNADKLLALLLQRRDEAVPGREAYEIHQGVDDPHQLMMVERWTTREAHQADFEKNVLASGMLDTVMALMTGPPAQPVYYELR